MYYIKRNGVPATTTDPDEVTKENFLVEPGGENRVWVKLTKHEFDQKSGEKRMLVNQINSLNPGDFEFCARNWRQNEIKIEMLHDPRPELKGDGVEDKLAKLKTQMGEKEADGENGENPTEEDWKKTIEAKEIAEKRAAELEAELAEMKAKAEAETRAAFEAQEKAKAEEEARAKAKAEEEARAKAEAESKETKGKTK